MENTIDFSSRIIDGERDVVIDYYVLQHGKVEDNLHISMCPGDLYKICNVLWDYENILKGYEDLFPDGGSTLMAEVYGAQLNKIRKKIETALDYSVEDAHEKCVRHSAKKVKDEGIGEEAMVLAIRKASETAKQKDAEILATKPERKKQKKEEKPSVPEHTEPVVEQMNIFDIMEE